MIIIVFSRSRTLPCILLFIRVPGSPLHLLLLFLLLSSNGLLSWVIIRELCMLAKFYDLTLCVTNFYSLKSFWAPMDQYFVILNLLYHLECFLFVLINSNVWYFLLTFYGTCWVQTCCISCFLVSLVIQALLFYLFIWYVPFQFLSLSITKYIKLRTRNLMVDFLYTQ